MAGPHDSHVGDVLIFSSSLKEDRAYDNLWLEKGNARWGKVHSYSTADILPNRVRNSLFIDVASSGNEFTLSQFEGGATNVRILGNNNIFDDTCRVYYPWDGININLAGNGNIINCFCGEEYRGIGLPAARGVVFAGDLSAASGNYVDIIAVGCGGGAIDFGGSGGSNVVRARGYNTLSTDVGYAALPQASDEVDVRIIGGTKTIIRRSFGAYNRNVSGVSAAGTTQATATALSDLVSVYRLEGGSGGLRLPNATDLGSGAEIVISNITASTISVYPSSGGNIAGLGLNNPLSLPGLKTVRLFVIDAEEGQWSAMIA